MRLIQWLKAKVPTRDELLANRWTRPFAHRLGDPNIWHFNRRSVARGVALGMFCGILIPIGQSVVAALFAVSARANVAVAALVTFITNPFTTPLVYAASYKIGEWVVQRAPSDPADYANIPQDWTARAYDLVVYVPVGLLIMATTGAVAGFALIHILWRMWVGQRWQSRKAARRAHAGAER